VCGKLLRLNPIEFLDTTPACRLHSVFKSWLPLDGAGTSFAAERLHRIEPRCYPAG
jgi:hypothetical protein